MSEKQPTDGALAQRLAELVPTDLTPGLIKAAELVQERVDYLQTLRASSDSFDIAIVELVRLLVKIAGWRTSTLLDKPPSTGH